MEQSQVRSGPESIHLSIRRNISHRWYPNVLEGQVFRKVYYQLIPSNPTKIHPNIIKNPLKLVRRDPNRQNNGTCHKGSRRSRQQSRIQRPIRHTIHLHLTLLPRANQRRHSTLPYRRSHQRHHLLQVNRIIHELITGNQAYRSKQSCTTHQSYTINYQRYLCCTCIW